MSARTNNAQTPAFWEMLKRWLTNVNKSFKPKKAAVFDAGKLYKCIEKTGLSPVELQKRVLILIAFCGDLRAREDYLLNWENVTISESPNEISIDAPKSKGNVHGRCFIISVPDFHNIVKDHKETKSYGSFL